MYISYCFAVHNNNNNKIIMPTGNTCLKNITLAGDSETTNEMVVLKINIYQRTFLIVARSLLALLVLIAVTGKSDGQYLQSSVNEISEGAVALASYQVDSSNFALIKDIFDFDADPKNYESNI